MKLQPPCNNPALPLAACLLLAAAVCVPLSAQSGNSSQPPPSPAPAAQPTPFPQRSGDQTEAAERQRATEELQQEEHQRILGVIPNFNTTSNLEAAALSVTQKFDLAFRSAVDPFEFVAAALDAGYSQATDAYSGYGQGMQGYGKRFGAAYADSFDGAIMGNAVFPSVLHEDPRYFRKGNGSIGGRLWWAILSTVRCRSDGGEWVPNYGNVLGNIAAGGISNLYYPATDRGIGLTFERAFTVTAEGALGSIGVEFWPDIQRKFFSRKGH